MKLTGNFLSQDNVSKAKQRIILASLYLGTGEKEKQLVSDPKFQSYYLIFRGISTFRTLQNKAIFPQDNVSCSPKTQAIKTMLMTPPPPTPHAHPLVDYRCTGRFHLKSVPLSGSSIWKAGVGISQSNVHCIEKDIGRMDFQVFTGDFFAL